MHKVSSKMYEKCLFIRNKDQKNEIGIFCDPKRAVDIFISLPLIWIWSLYIDQNGKFKECLVPKYILQSTSTSTKSLLLCCSFFPKLRWWHWPMWRSAILQTCLCTTTVYLESFIIVGAYFRGLWVFCFFVGMLFCKSLALKIQSKNISF